MKNQVFHLLLCFSFFKTFSAFSFYFDQNYIDFPQNGLNSTPFNNLDELLSFIDHPIIVFLKSNLFCNSSFNIGNDFTIEYFLFFSELLINRLEVETIVYLLANFAAFTLPMLLLH